MNAEAQTWNALDAELAAWRQSSREVTVWWRDDDASEQSVALGKMQQLSFEFNVPITLAVIPHALKPSLEPELRDWSQVSVVQHGYAHVNHALGDSKKSEFGGRHDLDNRCADIAQGREALTASLQGKFEPVFVPPWNRIHEDIVERLPSLGLHGLSTFKPRAQATPFPGLTQTNCHVDIINWRDGRGFVGHAGALAALTDHLRMRRSSHQVPDEPTGVLTHHLVHDEDCWTFLKQLFEHMRSDPNVRWLSTRETFG